jgi:hypothetical protein
MFVELRFDVLSTVKCMDSFYCERLCGVDLLYISMGFCAEDQCKIQLIRGVRNVVTINSLA